MTPALVKEIVKWIIDHIESPESMKTLLKHVYLPIKLTEEQLEEIIGRIVKARNNEIELDMISREIAKKSEENLNKMFV
ncbi:hypothetical protein GGQ84_002198 [Desulfitispora alkaliphila]|uniref:hypothetical protein n=1 Tax=Desulfitispora alkaliphila TaxID=622674 RepID=UPI003D25C0F5